MMLFVDSKRVGGEGTFWAVNEVDKSIEYIFGIRRINYYYLYDH